MIVLAKLNALEILQHKKAIMSRADSIKTLYQELKAGILSLTDIQEQVDMNKKRFFENTDFGNMPINQITENTIRLFLLQTVKELKLCKKSCGKLFGYIKNTIRYARVEKIILDKPVEFLEPKDFTKHSVEVERTSASTIPIINF